MTNFIKFYYASLVFVFGCGVCLFGGSVCLQLCLFLRP